MLLLSLFKTNTAQQQKANSLSLLLLSIHLAVTPPGRPPLTLFFYFCPLLCAKQTFIKTAKSFYSLMLLLLPLFGPFLSRLPLASGPEFHFEFPPNISRDFDAWQSLFLNIFIQ